VRRLPGVGPRDDLGAADAVVAGGGGWVHGDVLGSWRNDGRSRQWPPPGTATVEPPGASPEFMMLRGRGARVPPKPIRMMAGAFDATEPRSPSMASAPRSSFELMDDPYHFEGTSGGAGRETLQGPDLARRRRWSGSCSGPGETRSPPSADAFPKIHHSLAARSTHDELQVASRRGSRRVHAPHLVSACGGTSSSAPPADRGAHVLSSIPPTAPSTCPHGAVSATFSEAMDPTSLTGPPSPDLGRPCHPVAVPWCTPTQVVFWPAAPSTAMAPTRRPSPRAPGGLGRSHGHDDRLELRHRVGRGSGSR